MQLTAEPPQPGPSSWDFIKELSRPERRYFHWSRTDIAPGEADFGKGVRLHVRFPGSMRLLETAYTDLENFFKEAGVGLDGDYEILVEKGPTHCHESYRIEISATCCRILADDADGIRRAIYHLEDRLLAADGPFLPIGIIERKPWLKTRVSRCFFGPIKRPPYNRDELADEVDYYPDEYLNRLAHEAINGLWLTIAFNDLCQTSLTALAPDGERRLTKLRQTVAKCLRYGIKTYLFCIEPRARSANDPLLQDHPELKGALAWNDQFCFCPFSEAAQTYLYESTHWLFSQVPGLGGMINISYGERPTTCQSVNSGKDCPVCSQKTGGEIIAAALAPMVRGMHDVAPEAELISWLYVPENGIGSRNDAELDDIASKLPEEVVLQYNFESGGRKKQLGKDRHAGDYWLSYVGPSGVFSRMAATARACGNGMSAKIQVGCSHEVATVPFVPVPGLLYRKYKAMRDAGVSHVMQCWFFGNYPGIMNKAAGELAFEDFDDSETEFLLRLARPQWHGDASKVAAAWTLLAEGYGNYPLANLFQYYGPMHDGVVWPLHLKPVDEPLAPTWRQGYGASGDRYGECLGGFSLDEVLTLCRSLSDKWTEGCTIFQALRPDFSDNSERLKDIGLVETLATQFESGYSILKFYALREKLCDESAAEWSEALAQMEAIAVAEIDRSKKMLAACEFDSRLGFHSEAECYRYFPAKIRWRITQLEALLNSDFPEIRERIKAGKKPFEAQTLKSYVCNCGKIESAGDFSWRADYAEGTLKISLCDGKLPSDEEDAVIIFVETKPFYPPQRLQIKGGNTCEIPLSPGSKTVGFNIIRPRKNSPETEYCAWVPFSPLTHRLVLGNYNSHSMGRLIIPEEAEKMS